MRILIVAFWFPPANVIGALRVGKFARYLCRRGHEVQVLTTDIGEDRSLPLEIPKERVVYTDYRPRRGWLDLALARFHRPPVFAPTGSATPAQAEALPASGSLRSFLRRQYYSLIHLPDIRSDWIKTAVPAGRRLVREWRPEIIFASAPPNTGLIVAGRLARAVGIPWVADLRDLWVDNPYYSGPTWRRPIDALMEKLTLRSAAGLVTVSPLWAEQLHRRHGKPAAVVFNGYAEEDFPPLRPEGSGGELLRIRYLGSIYRGFRDPSPLFAALALLPDAVRQQIVVEFFCDDNAAVLDAAAAHRVANAVLIRPRVPYRHALELQMQADVLLLLQSTDERDAGNIPAKLFEYLYARRPILLIGYGDGIAAGLVRDRQAGLVSSSPPQIRDQLQAWLAAKQDGRLTRLDPSVSAGLSRDEQYRKLEHLLGTILNQSPLLKPSS